MHTTRSYLHFICRTIIAMTVCCVYRYIYVCVCVCVYNCLYMCVCVYACPCVLLYLRICFFFCMCMCMRLCLYICICTRAVCVLFIRKCNSLSKYTIQSLTTTDQHAIGYACPHFLFAIPVSRSPIYEGTQKYNYYQRSITGLSTACCIKFESTLEKKVLDNILAHCIEKP